MISSISDRTRNFYLIVFLVIINFIIKFIFIDFGCISGDEPFSIFHAQQELNDMVGMFENENNPPLHFVLLHFWIKLFGISSLSTRFLSLIFSVATVIFIYKLAINFFNIRIAMIASLLFTFSNYHIHFAHETRVYSLFALLTTVSMYLFLSLMKDNNGKKYFLLLIITNGLMIYAHFFGFCVLGIQVLSVFFIKELREKILLRYLIITTFTILLYLPYLEIFITRFTTSSGGTWVSKPNYDSLYINLWKFSNAPVNTVIFLLILIVALITVLLKKNRKIYSEAFNSKVILIWFLFPYLFLFAISFIIPMFLDRYLVFLSIGFYLTIAIAVDYLAISKLIFYPVFLTVIFLMIFTSDLKSGHNQDLKELVKKIKKERKPNSAIYLCPSWINLGFTYHYNLGYFKNYNNLKTNLNNDNIFSLYDVSEINDTSMIKSPNVIYIDGWSSLVDPKGLILEKFRKNFKVEKLDNSIKGMKKYNFSN